MADPDALQPAGRIAVTEKSGKAADESGRLVTISYYDFDGLGFHSAEGDRISFLFPTSSGSDDAARETP